MVCLSQVAIFELLRWEEALTIVSCRQDTVYAFPLGLSS